MVGDPEGRALPEGPGCAEPRHHLCSVGGLNEPPLAQMDDGHRIGSLDIQGFLGVQRIEQIPGTQLG